MLVSATAKSLVLVSAHRADIAFLSLHEHHPILAAAGGTRRAQKERLVTTHTLPGIPLILGPYTVHMTMLPRESMTDRRCLADLSIEKGLLSLRMDLTGRRLARAFLQTLIRFIHYSRGCQKGCVEEAYTHSLATGMVEFAQRNPAAWAWFNDLLATITPAGRKSSQIANAGKGEAPVPPPPRRFLVGTETVTLHSIKTHEARGAFGYYSIDENRAELWDELCGANLAVVAIHEITHAIHDKAGVKDGSSHIAFRAAQTDGWLDFMLKNPGAWQWIVYLATHEAARPQKVALAA